MNTECTCVSKVERELAQLSFAMDDLRLFLDVNPENCEALAEYNDLLQKRKELRARLEEQEGMTDVFSESDAWSWAVTPFPWM